jgi:hypothetical protein
MYFPIFQYKKEKKWIMKTMKAVVSVMGEYEKQQSVNLMYISMELSRFTNIYAVSAYNHKRCEIESH